MDNNGFDIQKFSTPAVYQIELQGEMDDGMSDRLGGMQISRIKKNKSNMITVLTGVIRDQTALSGILNSLYDMHITVLSVNVLKKDSN